MSDIDWLGRWQQNRIGFHEQDVNTYLQRYLALFNLQPGDDIFIPLCGKTHDIAWLAQQGYRVIGIELSAIAIESFFKEQKLSSQRYQSDRFVLHKSGNISLLQGDFFDLKPSDLASCKMVYDRAALIAIDEKDRARYCDQMLTIMPATAEQLLITLDYDQALMNGPPFSVSDDELRGHYQGAYGVNRLAQHDVLAERPRWREQGLTYLTETVYQLSKN